MNRAVRLFLAAFAATLLLSPPVALVFAQDFQSSLVIRDEQGREIVPGGYVTITEDGVGIVRYTMDDYKRMVRMGANFQVIRTTLGRLGGWPGKEADPAYLGQLDDMVRMGQKAGLKTIFKLVVYDIQPFGDEQWEAIYHNTDGTQDALLGAWKKIWTRYRDEPSVFGYDLLNEPQCRLDLDETRCSSEYLFPTLRRLVDAMHAVSPGKWALYQPQFKTNSLWQRVHSEPIHEPLGRDHIIYAPHLYTMNPDTMLLALDRYVHEAAISQAPLLIGEWGPATALAADNSPELQLPYTNVYQTTASAFDHHDIGAIKAWFCGTRFSLKPGLKPKAQTWAIFSDDNAVGHVERKYITDVLARPRPLAIAGHIEHYGYDFATHILEMTLKPDSNLGSTEIFVPLDRFYPDGFRIEVGSGLILALKPGDAQLRALKSADETSREQARLVNWDPDSEHIVIRKWILSTPALTVKIAPITERATLGASQVTYKPFFTAASSTAHSIPQSALLQQ